MSDTHLTVHFASPTIAFPLRLVTIGKNRRMAEAQVGTVHTDMAIFQNHATSKCHPELHLTLQSSSFAAQGGVHSTPRSRACPRTQSRDVGSPRDSGCVESADCQTRSTAASAFGRTRCNLADTNREP